MLVGDLSVGESMFYISETGKLVSCVVKGKNNHISGFYDVQVQDRIIKVSRLYLHREADKVCKRALDRQYKDLKIKEKFLKILLKNGESEISSIKQRILNLKRELKLD